MCCRQRQKEPVSVLQTTEVFEGWNEKRRSELFSVFLFKKSTHENFDDCNQTCRRTIKSHHVNTKKTPQFNCNILSYTVETWCVKSQSKIHGEVWKTNQTTNGPDIRNTFMFVYLKQGINKEKVVPVSILKLRQCLCPACVLWTLSSTDSSLHTWIINMPDRRQIFALYFTEITNLCSEDQGYKFNLA